MGAFFWAVSEKLKSRRIARMAVFAGIVVSFMGPVGSSGVAKKLF